MENLDALTPTTLAKLYKALEPIVEDFSLVDPIAASERLVLTDLLEAVLDAGQRNCGSDFVDMVM